MVRGAKRCDARCTRARRALWERVASGPVATHVLAADEPRADPPWRGAVASRSAATAGPQSASRSARCTSSGAGPGSGSAHAAGAAAAAARRRDSLRPAGERAVLERHARDAGASASQRPTAITGQQEHIHDCWCALAGEASASPRLKGGDPFVFGARGRGDRGAGPRTASPTPWSRASPPRWRRRGRPTGPHPRRLASSVTLVNGTRG